MFATYVKLYYDKGTCSSVYLVDIQDPGFKACFLVKKDINEEREIKKGSWDSVHIVTCNLKEAPKVTYKVVSTVMITIDAVTPAVGNFTISDSCSKTTDESMILPTVGAKIDIDHFHIRTIGRIIESNESVLRNDVFDHISKQRRITNTARMMGDQMSGEQRKEFK